MKVETRVRVPGLKAVRSRIERLKRVIAEKGRPPGKDAGGWKRGDQRKARE